MGKMLRIVPFIIFLVALIGCEGDIQKFEPESNVFALMLINKDTYNQFIIVDQSFDINDSLPRRDTMFLSWGIPPPVNGVKDANVSISFEEKTLNFGEVTWENHEGLYYRNITFFNDKVPYTLNVKLPWGDTIVGSAMMPTILSISCPQNGDTISIRKELYDSNMVYWNCCNNVMMYMINFVDNYWGSPGSYPYFTTDTCCPFFALRASSVENFFFPFYPYKFIVMGISPEYVEYMDPRNGGRANLSSGYGMFAGITFDTISVYFIE